MKSAIRTLILGLDAFDPAVFERLSAQGQLPNLTRYAERGGYSRFQVSDPPQSEVSWTSIATGLNPGGHGIFDFVHRDPATYALSVSLLPTRRSVGGIQFAPPHTARTIFDHAAENGFPATALWWPATFPARLESLVRSLPGLGTPDIQGRLGVGILLASSGVESSADLKTAVAPLERQGHDRYLGVLGGPVRKTRTGALPSTVEVRLDLADDRSARLTIGRQVIELTQGIWSPILELTFQLGPLVSVRALTRVILTRVQPDVRLYFLPLQLHPLRSPWRYASPRRFVRQTWAECGPFLTLGWPQDTTGLEDGCITDDQFLTLCASIMETRERVLMYHLDRFQEGLLASVFDSLDRIQHMFRRDRPDVVEAWYGKLDALVGRVVNRLAEREQAATRIVIVSDHGFSRLDFKVHLNRWLMEQGYLVAGEGDGPGSLQAAQWSQSRAYAVGLNSLYLNQTGREGLGCVPVAGREELLATLCDNLLHWRGPDGRAVINRVRQREDAFEGPLATYGPDLVVGYAPGYRASSETGTGKWGAVPIKPNSDHWGADHCIDAQAVPGVLFCNQGLAGFPAPSYRDIPVLTVGTALEGSAAAPPRSQTGEDQRAVEERLKGLGYL
jgi:predicted AlkP superfamily phosphohydrolase/phosphomutase